MEFLDNQSDHMQPLVSIIIPVFNAEKTLAQTIDSALTQTYENFEIIVVDDGSTDGSFNIAEQFIAHGVRLLSQPNNGASSARNHGLRVSSGDFIQFLDADDVLHPKKIECQVRTARKYTNLHLIGGIWRRFDYDISKPYLPMPYTEKETKIFDNVQWLIDRPYMIPHVWLVSKELIGLAGEWNEKLSFNDDGEFFYRVIAASAEIIIDHEAVSFYRTGNISSLSNRKDRRALISWIASVKSYKEIVTQLAGARAKESVNRYFFEIGYNCIGKYEDLYEVCKSEMYDPHFSYNLSDNLVFYLSKIIGLPASKRVRSFVSSIRETKMVKGLIYRTKNLIGWQSY
jgi:glycosyltransferase involved in cell wall biosynthesis